MKMLPLAGYALLVLAALGGGYLWLENRQFADRILELRSLVAAGQQMAAPAASPELPAIVRDFALRAGGREGRARLFHARQEATLATARNAPPIAVTAEQWTGMVASGIVWAATGSMNGLPVTVFDAYVGGRGELSARLLGAFQVAGGSGADYDKGELMRYLSELPVYPDAILNNASLSWRQLDERTVEVSAHSASGPASVRFIFDEAGDIVRMESDDRPMSTDDGRTVPTPWHGIYGNYTHFGSYRVPAYGEVGWVLPDGLFTYWHGTLTAYEQVE
jgi:hypothetical protein